MKLTIILLIACVSTIYADEKIPIEIRRIQDERDTAIAREMDKIDQQYKVALLKQKDAYIRQNDLEKAKLIDAILIELSDELSDTKTSEVKKRKVKATYSTSSPKGTGIFLNKGQRFVIVPDENDKWTGGGSKSGVYCDYMGYDDRGNKWMRLTYQIESESPVQVVSNKEYIADSDGELFLYAHDENADGNEGHINVKIEIFL